MPLLPNPRHEKFAQALAKANQLALLTKKPAIAQMTEMQSE
jgi:hypothetical protein